MTDKQIIIEDCPYFIGGNCQEYLDGVCENHKCDLKIIRELEEKLSNKRKECDELHETVKSQKEEIKNLNYTLYEERNLTTDLAKANLRISTLERDLSSARNRFKHENQQNKEIIKVKEQECEELKKQYNCYACDTCKGKEDYINLKRHCENAIKSLHDKQAELDQLKAELTRANCQIADDEILQCDMREAIEELKAENEKLKEEIKDLKSSNENLRLYNEDTCKRMNEYSQDYRNLYNNFDAEVKKQVANKIKIKERTFKANETKLKKEIDYLKKRVNALLLDIEALRR